MGPGKRIIYRHRSEYSHGYNMKKEKLLQYANLSPDVDWIDRIEQVHPMKQITIMSLIQVGVFGFMLLSFSIINLFIS